MNKIYHHIRLYTIFCLYFTNVLFVYAQPDQEYISRLKGIKSISRIDSIGQQGKAEVLNWKNRKAPGFKANNKNARLQASLEEWIFIPVDTAGNLKSMINLTLPHHFPAKRNYNSGWYICKSYIEKENNERVVILFDQVKFFCQLYVNEKLINHHFGGLTPFEFDITDALTPGENLICLFVHDQMATIDENKAYNQLGVQRPWDLKPEGGINRVPILEKRSPVFIHDIFIKTSVRDKKMIIEYEITNESSIKQSTNFHSELFRWPDGETVPVSIGSVVNEVDPGQTIKHEIEIPWKDPQMWSPEHPNLYVLRSGLSTENHIDIIDTRFGFREFWIEGKRFMLNGKPIRLIGESSYDQHSVNNRDFHRELYELQKQTFGINANRLHAHLVTGDAPLGADEAGVLLLNQSAIWSVMHSYYRNGGDWFLANIQQEFEEWVRRDRNSPSVVIWDVENEMLRIDYEQNIGWVKKLNDFVLQWDTTRPLCNSGAGWFDLDQEMVHLHMQEHYTKIMNDWSQKGTNPLIMGEFWIGGRGADRLPSALEFQRHDDVYLEKARIYQEKLLIMRKIGPSGIMPFRISNTSFYEPEGFKKKYNLEAPDKLIVGKRPKELTGLIKHGTQPMTAFIWPRQDYITSNQETDKQIIICNDSESVRTFEVSWGFENGTESSAEINVEPAGQNVIEIKLPPVSTNKKFIVTLKSDNKIVSTDAIEYSAIPDSLLQSFRTKRKTVVYEGEHSNKQNQIYKNLNWTSVNKIPVDPEQEILIIAPGKSDKFLDQNTDRITAFLNQGGRILCLKQDKVPSWSPVQFGFWSALQPAIPTYKMMGWNSTHKDVFYIKNAPILYKAHPIFNGIGKISLNDWNLFDGRISDDVFLRPSSMGDYSQGAWRTLAGGTHRDQITIAEARVGKGVVLFCQAHVLENIENPQAFSLLNNMVKYLDSNQIWPGNKAIKLSGIFSPDDLNDFLNTAPGSLSGAQPEKNDVLIATDGSNMDELKAWANAGGKVLVLSDQVSGKFDNIQIAKNDSFVYAATINAVHPLLSGVSSGSFLNYANNSIQGYFKTFPSDAEILLNGFQHHKNDAGFRGFNLIEFNDAGPLAIKIKYGKGEFVLTTLTPWHLKTLYDKELLSTILANAGLDIAPTQKPVENIRVKNTVPLVIDGNLNDCTEDMEDRLVTQYVHAQPVYLRAENAIEGNIHFDLDFSGIIYFLWNENSLYIAGVVFKEEKRMLPDEPFAQTREYQVCAFINNEKIEVIKSNEVMEVLVNNRKNKNIIHVHNITHSSNLTDAQNMEFKYYHRNGIIQSMENVPGETFEVEIPWNNFKEINFNDIKPGKILIQLRSEKAVLQNPAKTELEIKNNWNNIQFVEEN